MSSEVKWADHAASDFLDAIRTSHSDSVDAAKSFVGSVFAAVQSIAEAPRTGVSLPEMGDASILEVPVRTSTIRYRLVYDVDGDLVRILHFTNNTTCYRNGMPLRNDTVEHCGDAG